MREIHGKRKRIISVDHNGDDVLKSLTFPDGSSHKQVLYSKSLLMKGFQDHIQSL